MLVGLDVSDDAGVYRLTDDIALIQTLDFFTPIVDDPYDFGRIAAANAFSDVYAMGGKPLTAMNIVCFPIKDMDKEVLRLILQGGLEMVHKAGATLVGGHSVEDPELKFGLSVTGIVHPQKFLTNAKARPGDILILTKPLGTGILATAHKAGLLDKEATKQTTELMATLNKGASEAMSGLSVSACTDITGFGLLGHCLEMAKAGNVGMKIDAKKVPIIPDTEAFASMGLIPGGGYSNQNFCKAHLKVDASVDTILIDIFSDPQTSGGLLIAVSKDEAASLIKRLREKKTPAASIIGEVVAEHPKTIHCY